MKKKVFSARVVSGLLFLILAAAAFLRLYKLNELLGFYYDQGRDALVIYRLLHERKLFLVGPVTGIEGIFLGPFYYYLIAPFYFLGGGSPVFVAAFLAWLSVGAIFLLYLIGVRFFDRPTGLLAALLYSFSYDLVVFDRWLSNPNPLPLFSLLALWGLYQIYQGREKFWLLVALAVGLGLQLEAAAAVFFLPAVLIFIFWQRKKIKNWRFVFAAGGIFLLTLFPQIAFNFRHQGILLKAFKKFLVDQPSFRLSLWTVAKLRLQTYWTVFSSKLFYNRRQPALIFLLLFAIFAWRFRRRFLNPGGKILLLWLAVPLLGLLFYQGNFGRIWDYYFVGVYPVFILLVSALLVACFRHRLSRLVALAFLAVFFWINLTLLRTYYRIGIGIILRHQLAAIDWIYQDAGGKDFNVDVYVPPVIPYAYDYLFTWYGTKKYGRRPLAKKVSLLYTLAEADSDHPERLAAWLKRQAGIGRILTGKKFGDITVQRRERHR